MRRDSLIVIGCPRPLLVTMTCANPIMFQRGYRLVAQPQHHLGAALPQHPHQAPGRLPPDQGGGRPGSTYRGGRVTTCR